MEGADFSAFQVLWFIIAGFVLGFATSMLWEWLYYRGKRMAQVAALTVLPTVRADSQAVPADDTLPADESWAMPYRGSGIYLENEQHATASAGTSTPAAAASLSPLLLDEIDEIDEAIDETEPVTPPNHLRAPRINPATLAALQSAVAQSPIAHSAAHTKVSPVSPARDIAAPVTRDQPDANALPAQAPAADEVHVREIVSYGAPSADLSSADDAAIAAEPDASEIKVVEILPGPVPVPVANRTHRAADYPDDLMLIKGVGEAYKRRLYGAGIYTWRQVAESDTENLRHITRAKPNANIDGWHAQAQALAEKYQRWHTTFQGPLDDFTYIDGIGAITADTLYKAGLCTYEQLAAVLPDELAKIVPAPTVGDENDFDGWINQAVQLANAKRHNPGSHV